MTIQPNDMISMSLPAQGWDWLVNILPQLSVPMQPRDQIVAMLQGQMQQHIARAEAAAALAAESEQPPANPPPAPAPRRQKAK